MRTLGVLIATASAALALAACGTESVSVSADDADAQAGAEIFATHCAGCHTISAAGTQGSGNRALRVQGPNFDQRKETYDDVLFALHNGGFSGAIMPQNIVVDAEATAVATFLDQYSGSDVVVQPRPTATSPGTEVGPSNSTGEGVDSAESSQESGSSSSGASSQSSDSQ